MIVAALICSTPVVSANLPIRGLVQILRDGKFGRLVPVEDVKALAAAMEASLETPTDADALKARAQDFSIDKAVDKYEALLFPTIGSRAPR